MSMSTSERAWQIWPLLAHAAAHRQTLTYEQVGQLSGMFQGGLGPILEHIQSYCLINNLPPLTVLVVGKSSGLPSEGFVAATDAPGAMADVFVYDWRSAVCPDPDALARAVQLR